MIHRRQFIGSAAALCAMAPASRLFGNSIYSANTKKSNWTCSTIQTIARDNGNQPPVVTGIVIAGCPVMLNS